METESGDQDKADTSGHWAQGQVWGVRVAADPWPAPHRAAGGTAQGWLPVLGLVFGLSPDCFSNERFTVGPPVTVG